MNIEEIRDKLESIENYSQKMYANYVFDPFNNKFFYKKFRIKTDLYFYSNNCCKSDKTYLHENGCEKLWGCTCKNKKFYKITIFHEPSKYYSGSEENLTVIENCKFIFERITILDDGKMEIIIDEKEYSKLKNVEINDHFTKPQMYINDSFNNIVFEIINFDLEEDYSD